MDKDIKELKELSEAARIRICGIIGVISRIGNDKFHVTTHIHLGQILRNLDRIDEDIKKVSE